MKSNEYRLNVRFDLTDEKQKRTAEALQKLDRKKYQSINAFVVTAVGDYLDRLEGSDMISLESIRAMFREELQAVSFVSAVPAENSPPNISLTEEEKAENDATILSALAMFE